jgi:hypothetical protein
VDPRVVVLGRVNDAPDGSCFLLVGMDCGEGGGEVVNLIFL